MNPSMDREDRPQAGAVGADDPLAWLGLGRSLAAQMRFGEAEAAFRRALEIAPTHIPALRELGLTLERTNRMDALGTLLDDAAAAGLGGELPDLRALRALREGSGEEAWAIARTIDARADPVRLLALKAKCADRAGDSAQAFAAAEAMNRAIPGYAEWRRVGRDFRNYLRSGCEAMAAWPRELPTAPPTDRPSPAFLVGFPRSGTTLADTFLMGHPDVHVLEEVQMLATAARSLPTDIDLPATTPEQLGSAREVYYAELDHHLEPGVGGLVIDKLPLNMFSLPLIASLFPDARVIFVQRHPCDCVLSAFMQDFRLNAAMASFLDLGDAAELYDSGMRFFIKARERTRLDIHTLVYEQLIADPESTLRAAVDFLGLEWRPELLDHRATAAARGAIATPSYSQVSHALSARPSGRWRRYEEQLAGILPLLQPWAERLGYSG